MMRLTVPAALGFVSLGIAMAVPAQAQHVAGVSGVHFNLGTPMSAPVNGYAYGFGDVSRPGVPGGDMVRAQRLIAAGDYAQADDLLSVLVGRSSSRQVRFLKGVARLGMGDAAAARRYFEQSLYRGRNGYPGAMSGLALAEIRLGNRDAAENILTKLRYQQERCGQSCDRAKPLDAAVSVVEKALA
ncbi:tol-pal system YbgF family protein [Sphingobium rhizovicinum]|uniref:Tol-pal system YbgF family protein n=1 Tax=Sphingobium rhizovicinum TaxID=432308 RepID=A0ABV7NGJ4_9SPHN